MKYFISLFLNRPLCVFFAVILSFSVANAQQAIHHDDVLKTIKISDAMQRLSMVIDYSKGCMIKELNVNGKNTLSSSGVYTGFRTKGGSFSSAAQSNEIKVTSKGNEITIDGINYGDHSIRVGESWTFKRSDDRIYWTIKRTYSNLAKLEETAFPQWNFIDLSVWKGGILDNGGMVWCKYLKDVNDTYGVHTGGATFWNPESGDALRIAAASTDTC